MSVARFSAFFSHAFSVHWPMEHRLTNSTRVRHLKSLHNQGMFADNSLRLLLWRRTYSSFLVAYILCKIELERVHAINVAHINFLPTICLAVIALQIKWEYSVECFPFSKQTSHVNGISSDIVKRLSKFFFISKTRNWLSYFHGNSFMNEVSKKSANYSKIWIVIFKKTWFTRWEDSKLNEFMRKNFAPAVKNICFPLRKYKRNFQNWP